MNNECIVRYLYQLCMSFQGGGGGGGVGVAFGFIHCLSVHRNRWCNYFVVQPEPVFLPDN